MQVQQQKNESASARIDPALWDIFAGADNLEEYCRAWLVFQCSFLPRAVQGVLILGESDKGPFTPISRWPEEGQDPGRLAEISERVLHERCGLLAKLDGPDSSHRYGVAYPIQTGGYLYGVIAVEISADSEDHLKTAMTHLQWGVSRIEVFFLRRQAKENESLLSRLRSAVDLLAGVLSVESFDRAGMAFVTDLSTLLQCDRVSLAFMRKNHARIQAVSHSAQFGERMNLIRAISAAMDEAVVQRKDIFYPLPQGSEPMIIRDHEELARQHGAGCILTMAFYGKDRFNGAITLERPAENPFSDADAAFCRSVASLLLPALEIKRQNDRVLIFKVLEAVKNQLSRLFGARYLGRKLLLALAVAVVLFFYHAQGNYRIAARTVLEGAVKRVVVAPFDGYIREAEVRAGDRVEAKTLLCILDDRDLRLERLNWVSKQSQFQRQRQEALAKHDRAKAEILKSQLDQAQAELNLVEAQLQRTRITAPFRGVVISGDLSQRLGGSVGRGEILFEVAPLDAYRVVLEVDERRIADVKVGQKGRMILSALPHEQFDFLVEKITPIATAKEGLNYFRVEAELARISERLRPGMEGIGKIDVDERKLIIIWSRDLIEWVRLWLWSWWP